MTIQRLDTGYAAADGAAGWRRLVPRLPFSPGAGYITTSFALMVLVLIAPAIYGFIYSLYNVMYLMPTRFVGFANYARIFNNPDILDVTLRSAVFAACAVSLTIATALAMAIWIDRLNRWLALAIQLMIVIPWIISHVVGALLFRWVFVNDIGFAIYFLESIGIHNIRPLEDSTIAMMALIGYTCWRTLGFALLLFLAGLKSIPSDLYEAAYVDGASAWQEFRSITLPMLKTPMMIVFVMLTVSCLNNVEGPLIVTGGGPADATNILPLDLYMRAFARFDFNTAMPMAIAMFAVNICFAVVYVRLVRRNG